MFKSINDLDVKYFSILHLNFKKKNYMYFYVLLLITWFHFRFLLLIANSFRRNLQIDREIISKSLSMFIWNKMSSCHLCVKNKINQFVSASQKQLLSDKFLFMADGPVTLRFEGVLACFVATTSLDQTYPRLMRPNRSKPVLVVIFAEIW